MLGKIGNFNTPDRAAYGCNLAPDIGVAAAVFKTGGFMGILGTIGKPQGVLKPERLIHLGAFCDQPIIKCGGFLPSASGQCLVGEGHHKVRP